MPYEVSWVAKDGETERVSFESANLAFSEAAKVIEAGYSATVTDKSSGAVHRAKAILDIHETNKSEAIRGKR
jgi:hypothetical protein